MRRRLFILQTNKVKPNSSYWKSWKTPSQANALTIAKRHARLPMRRDRPCRCCDRFYGTEGVGLKRLSWESSKQGGLLDLLGEWDFCVRYREYVHSIFKGYPGVWGLRTGKPEDKENGWRKRECVGIHSFLGIATSVLDTGSTAILIEKVWLKNIQAWEFWFHW